MPSSLRLGTPLELYDNPANRFVAGFIGSPAMNFIEAVLTTGDSGMSFRTKGGVSLPAPPHLASQSGREAVFGIRPEHIEIARDGREPSFTPTMSVVEPMGAETLILAHFEGGSITVSHRGRDDFKPGDELPIAIDPRHAHVFARTDESAMRASSG